jgi:hypothetical protein
MLSLGLAKSGAGLLGQMFILLSSVNSIVRLAILIGAGLAIAMLIGLASLLCRGRSR